jgi:hypothetical protein
MDNSQPSLEPSSSFSGADPSGRTSWRWRFEDSTGSEVGLADGSTAGGVTGFPSQSDAESWIGEVWRDLLEEGVDQVRLFEGDREVYGPMSLHSAG